MGMSWSFNDSGSVKTSINGKIVRMEAYLLAQSKGIYMDEMETYKTIIHADGDKINNRLSNLKLKA
mgnify:CR=1 FL=1